MPKFKLHFVPLGGVVGVTKNMYVYELWQDNKLQDIIVIDCGIGFPQEKDLGVDLIIPDVSYLADKIDKIRAVLLSHGHEDHISALPKVYRKLGSPPIYTAKLTALFVKSKFQETRIVPDVLIIKPGSRYKFGSFEVQFIPITHSIPDSMHILLKTPIGNIYHGPDFKLDLNPPYGALPDFHAITQAGKNGILCLLSDCLGANKEGLTASESTVAQVFEDQMRRTKGKFIMTTFASNISRIQQCLDVASKFNRTIVFLGRSMRDNTKHALETGYLKIAKSLLADEKDISKIPPNRLCLIVSGSQGQFGSALAKIATRQNKNVQISSGDRIVFSSDPIPGNESEVYNIIEDLYSQGAEVMYSDIQEQIHASGHGSQEDLKFLVRFTQPQYFIPIGGDIRHQRGYQKMCVELGYKKEQVMLLQEGETVWFTPHSAEIGEKIETKTVYVDAVGVDNLNMDVLQERRILASDGVVSVNIVLDKNQDLLAPINLTSRGLILEKQEKALFLDLTRLIQNALTENLDIESMHKKLYKIVNDYLHKKLNKHPVVLINIMMI